MDGSGGRSVVSGGSVVGFEDDALMALSGAPFVKYDVTGLKEFVRRAVYEAEGTTVSCKA